MRTTISALIYMHPVYLRPQTYISFSLQSNPKRRRKIVLNLEAVTPHTSLVSLDKVPAVRFALSRSRLDETVIPGLLGLRAGATTIHYELNVSTLIQGNKSERTASSCWGSGDSLPWLWRLGKMMSIEEEEWWREKRLRICSEMVSRKRCIAR